MELEGVRTSPSGLTRGPRRMGTNTRRKLALWRYDHNTVRPHSSLGNQTPQQARRTHEKFEGSAPGALASDGAPEYQNPTCRLLL